MAVSEYDTGADAAASETDPDRAVPTQHPNFSNTHGNSQNTELKPNAEQLKTQRRISGGGVGYG
ncbi:hypothetical protein [Streptomyces violascens]|uniref:hypothetical protein n=1 Tax=Streptomyces violascens TaxID=67381 RepID=UPI0036C5E94A